jgi:hypothetical protein
MSASTINRGPITDRVLTELAVDGLPVGDNSAPTTAFGWQGEPNADGSNFIPWMAAYGGTARPGGDCLIPSPTLVLQGISWIG